MMHSEKKIKGKLSYILSMVYFLMKMTSSKISQWTKIHFPRWDFFSECIIRKRRLYAFKWCIQKKNPISWSVFSFMVYYFVNSSCMRKCELNFFFEYSILIGLNNPNSELKHLYVKLKSVPYTHLKTLINICKYAYVTKLHWNLRRGFRENFLLLLIVTRKRRLK